MSEKELSELIHKCVSESFEKNKTEFYAQFNTLVSSLPVATADQAKNLPHALFEYTAFVSELNCIAMSKMLSSAGILQIVPTSD